MCLFRRLLAVLLLAHIAISANADPARDYAEVLQAAQKRRTILAELEWALKRAADAGLPEAQLFYGLMLVDLRRLASWQVPVHVGFDHVHVENLDKLPAPPEQDIERARQLLEGLRTHPVFGRQARLGLAYIIAVIEPLDASASSAIDALLNDSAEARLTSAILLEMAGRCEMALPRYRALQNDKPDPALAARVAACEADWPKLPETQLAPLTIDGANCAFGSAYQPSDWRGRVYRLSWGNNRSALYTLDRNVGCLWEKVSTASDVAGTRLDAAQRIARYQWALDAMGQPFNGFPQPGALALATLLLETGAPVEDALAILPRAGMSGRWRAATILREGVLLPPDPVRERALLEPGPGFSMDYRYGYDEATQQARLRLAIMLRDGIGGTANTFEAMRLFQLGYDEAAIAEFFAKLPWQLMEETEAPTTAMRSFPAVPIPDWLDPVLLEAQLSGFDPDPRDAHPVVLPIAGWPQPGLVLFATRELTRVEGAREKRQGLRLLRLIDAGNDGHPQVRRVVDWDWALSEAVTEALATCAPPREGETSRESPFTVAPQAPVAVMLGSGIPALRFSVSASEGYAGGGASFEGALFTRLVDDHLEPLLCVETIGFQSVAGNWRPDETREHDEYHDRWTLTVGTPRASGWRDIIARSPGKRRVVYRWNGSKYVAIQ
jgi:hypothetical protein